MEDEAWWSVPCADQPPDKATFCLVSIPCRISRIWEVFINYFYQKIFTFILFNFDRAAALCPLPGEGEDTGSPHTVLRELTVFQGHTLTGASWAMGVTREEVQLKHRDCLPACLPGSGRDLSIGDRRADKTRSGGWEGAGLEGRLGSEGKSVMAIGVKVCTPLCS